MNEQAPAQPKLRFAITMLIAAAALHLTISAVANTGQRPASPPQHEITRRITRPRLLELATIDQLKEEFQRDAGKLRLVVLVSPT